MNNQECIVRSQIVKGNSDMPVVFLLGLKQVNVVAVQIILTMCIQKLVFLIL